MDKPTLTIIPSVPLWKQGGRFCFDRKFYDGLLLYIRLWPGRIACVMSVGRSPLPDFGVIESTPDELPFTCITLEEGELVNETHIGNSTVVMASADAHDQLHIAALCRKSGVKCVYVIEYIPETRYQIVSMSSRNLLDRMRQYLYLWLSEKKRHQAFVLCDGLQSNGTPAYDAYRFAPNRLLYFDTRVLKAQLVSSGELERRISALHDNKPLRLAFSGRLVHMKGADHLVRLARKLKEQGVRFHLTIYGTGDLDREMKRYIEEHDLKHEVTMPGAVDFNRQLLPAVKESVDLFVCLHRQSDPSCTYLETLSCGVPIVGYLNRAFAGILDRVDVGWGAKLDDLDAVASIIRRLDADRTEIAGKARNSARFGSEHDFETTFRNRVDHLLSISKG